MFIVNVSNILGFDHVLIIMGLYLKLEKAHNTY